MRDGKCYLHIAVVDATSQPGCAVNDEHEELGSRRPSAVAAGCRVSNALHAMIHACLVDSLRDETANKY